MSISPKLSLELYKFLKLIIDVFNSPMANKVSFLWSLTSTFFNSTSPLSCNPTFPILISVLNASLRRFVAYLPKAVCTAGIPKMRKQIINMSRMIPAILVTICTTFLIKTAP